jgi:hypothetical protein
LEGEDEVGDGVDDRIEDGDDVDVGINIGGEAGVDIESRTGICVGAGGFQIGVCAEKL